MPDKPKVEITRNIRLTIAYDGTHFYGWQIQPHPNQPTVQGVLAYALESVLCEQVMPNGIGRTDRGAHAFAYVANFTTSNRSIPVEKFPPALNSILPESVRVLHAELAPPDFHACFSAIARHYVYIILNSPLPHPIYRNYTYFLSRPIDIGRLRVVCKEFVGEHNFTQFCSGYGEFPAKDLTRTIHFFRVAQLGKWIIFFIKGNGFLQGMIRTMISVCLNYEQGKVTLEDIRQALQLNAPLHSKYKTPVPANGLYFKRGYYRV